MSKIDFEEIVQTWALSEYHKSQRQRNGSSDNLRVDVNWEKTSLCLINHTWDELPLNHIKTSKSHHLCGNYRNDTDAALKQTIQLDKQTEAHCKVTVTQGHTKGLGANLCVILPDHLTSTTLAFGRSVNVSTNEVTNQSESMTWKVDTVITTPPRSVTKAEIIVKENSFEVGFKGKACLTGTVVANIHNKNTGAFISPVENDVSEIRMWIDENSIASAEEVDRNEQNVIWPVAGQCFFQFGVEHEVKLSQTALTTTICHK